MRFIYTFLLFALIFYSCKKSEIDQIPTDNNSVDSVVSEITIKNYVERTYRLVIGREPDSSEKASAISHLLASNADSNSRRIFIENIFSNQGFRKNFYNDMRLRILDGADTSEFSNWIYIFNLFLQDPSHQNEWPFFQYEYDRMVKMKNACSSYTKDSITMEEVERRMCDNYIYDQKNPGAANYVLSTFQNLINRNPSAAEQQASILMVNGSNSVLFSASGSTKEDYLDIFIQSNEYYEGQVIFMYLKYLNRVPGIVELNEGSQKYFSTKDFTSVQRDILVSDEFVGVR